MSFLLVGNRFDHEIRPVSNISVGAKENRADADRLETPDMQGISQDKRYLRLRFRDVT